MNKKAVEYVRKTITEYHTGNKQNGETIEEFIEHADYDIQKEVEEIFIKYLYPSPNNSEVLMYQQSHPLNPLNQQLKISNMRRIVQILDDLEKTN